MIERYSWQDKKEIEALILNLQTSNSNFNFPQTSN